MTCDSAEALGLSPCGWHAGGFAAGEPCENTASHRARLVEGAQAESFWQKEFAVLQSMVGSGRVLDVGSGNGRDAIVLSEHGYEVSGVEISPEFLSIAAERCLAASFQLPAPTSCRSKTATLIECEVAGAQELRQQLLGAICASVSVPPWP